MPEFRLYPALDVVWVIPPQDEKLDILIAGLHDFHPSAIEDSPSGLRIFFTRSSDRDAAAGRVRLAAPDATVSSIDVSDEAWAERSQASIGTVRVGRLVIAPPWADVTDLDSRDILIRIAPSMGFGTGHHASTRLCLRLLQDIDLQQKSMLDVGTGSSVLAIAASRLGADPVVAIDMDEDALTSARENIALNSADVTLHLEDLLANSPESRPQFDVVTANLTGALLQRAAPDLAALLSPSGVLIASGLQEDELAAVTAALEAAGLRCEGNATEDGWMGTLFTRD